MSVYIALLRGVNVGGKHILPMRDLREILATLDCEDVRTYIQSGNAVFRFAGDPEALTRQIRAGIKDKFGFSSRLLLLTRGQLQAIAACNPYPGAEQDPRFLHVWFMAEHPAKPDLEALMEKQTATESFELGSAAFYLHAPDGIGHSKLANLVEKCLGVDVTARNWRTVSKLLQLAATVGKDN